jgi:hypothetical protein
MHDHSKSLPFDAAWLVDGLQEEVAGEFGVRHVSPMVIIPSRISITSARIYLQPLVNLSSAPVFKFRISSIARTLNRRHMHEESALEIFFEPSVDARIFSSQVSVRFWYDPCRLLPPIHSRRRLSWVYPAAPAATACF